MVPGGCTSTMIHTSKSSMRDAGSLPPEALSAAGQHPSDKPDDGGQEEQQNGQAGPTKLGVTPQPDRELIHPARVAVKRAPESCKKKARSYTRTIHQATATAP